MPIIVAVYIDDKLILSKSLDAINHLKGQLLQEYELMDLGEVHWILGMEIIQDRERWTIELSQCRYIETILERFGMENGRAVKTPMEPNLKLVKLKAPEVDVKLYQSRLSALMYVMLATCPDLAFAVGALSKHAATPGEAHWAALKRVYRYLCGTTDTHLIYSGATKPNILGYVDVDWAGDINDRQSISGYVFIISGGAVSWSLKKQTSVALSSTEAEYMAAAAATKEALWLHSLAQELSLSSFQEPTTLLIDNQSAMALAKNAVFHDRTKHIAIQHHFICEKIDDEEITLQYIPTNEQVADVLTKPLMWEKHNRFIEGMGVVF